MIQAEGLHASTNGFTHELTEFVRDNIASALANHLGGVEVVEVAGSRVKLRMTASCKTCYFRRGCIENLVVPELEKRFGQDFNFVVR